MPTMQGATLKGRRQPYVVPDPAVSKIMCHHLICKPCGGKHGGCSWHCSQPPEGELAPWAGYTVDKRNRKAEKSKWKASRSYYAQEQSKRKANDHKQQESEQDARDEDRDMQQVVTREDNTQKNGSEGESKKQGTDRKRKREEASEVEGEASQVEKGVHAARVTGVGDRGRR